MKVIGTELYELGFQKAIEECIALSQASANNLCISASDANVLVSAKRTPSFKNVLHQFHWNLPDGVPSVWVLKLKGAKSASRISGPDFFEQLIKSTVDLPINHFLLGGAEGVANDLKKTCLKWGNTNIVGAFSPPYLPLDEMDLESFAEKVNEANTAILWVGLGTPKQIYFAHEIAKLTKVKCIITIGAAFDFHTNRIKKAPVWIQKIGMEWFYRLCQEPKRLGKRYFTVVPAFLWYNFAALFKSSRNT